MQNPVDSSDLVPECVDSAVKYFFENFVETCPALSHCQPSVFDRGIVYSDFILPEPNGTSTMNGGRGAPQSSINAALDQRTQTQNSSGRPLFEKWNAMTKPSDENILAPIFATAKVLPLMYKLFISATYILGNENIIENPRDKLIKAKVLHSGYALPQEIPEYFQDVIGLLCSSEVLNIQEVIKKQLMVYMLPRGGYVHVFELLIARGELVLPQCLS